MPINYRDYPHNWFTDIVPAIRIRSGDRCEGSPAFPDCRAKNKEPHPITGKKVILTTAHMDHDNTNNDLDNLRHLCQRCHLRHDLDQHVTNRKYGRNWKQKQLKLWP